MYVRHCYNVIIKLTYISCFASQ